MDKQVYRQHVTMLEFEWLGIRRRHFVEYEAAYQTSQNANGMLGVLALYAKFRENGKYCLSQVFPAFLPFGTIPIRAAKRSGC
jgi:hypothetical protein